MPYFSQRSFDRLRTCHPDLQRLFEDVIKDFDCIILEGHRDKERQDALLKVGKSQLAWPESKHNATPSLAVDVGPFEESIKNVPWNHKEKFYYFGGFVLGVAFKLGIKIRWGGDWDRDHDLRDQKFMDLVHFEIWEPSE